MSGGIDSTVTAYLLKEQGYQVKGIYFRLTDEIQIESASSVEDLVKKSTGIHLTKVKEAAQRINIPLEIVDYRDLFRKVIIKDFIWQYQCGMTPNPCILCNEKIKFKLLYEWAEKEGIPYIATGHYARIERNIKENKFLLRRGVDPEKDQSYFLYRLNQEILSRCFFPLGAFKKENVKEIALKFGLDPFRVKESQEICFVPGNNYRELIQNEKQIINKPGDFLNVNGERIGQHRGIAFYTVGQRKKIGLSLNSRKYIVRINPEQNTITIGDLHDLFQTEFQVENVNYLSIDPIIKLSDYHVQIRYNATPAPATILPVGQSRLAICFHDPQKAISPGQSAVFYQDEYVVGGGTICHSS